MEQDRIHGAMQSAPAESAKSVDESLAAQMQALVNEAAERVTFHRIEAEMWERTGEAAANALVRLRNHSPVAHASAESFLGQDAPGITVRG